MLETLGGIPAMVCRKPECKGTSKRGDSVSHNGIPALIQLNSWKLFADFGIAELMALTYLCSIEMKLVISLVLIWEITPTALVPHVDIRVLFKV